MDFQRINPKIYEGGMTDSLEYMIPHLEYMYKTVVDNNLTKILELGVNVSGYSTKMFLHALKSTHRPCQCGWLYSVDFKPCKTIVDKLKNNPMLSGPKWVFIHQDTRLFNIIEPQLHCAPFDLLFIDSSHTYEHTLFELRNYSTLVREGGYIFMHDIVSKGSYNPYNCFGLPLKHDTTGEDVSHAISDYVTETGYDYFILDIDLISGGLVLIRKGTNEKEKAASM